MLKKQSKQKDASRIAFGILLQESFLMNAIQHGGKNMKREQHGRCRGLILQSVVLEASKVTDLIQNLMVSQCAMHALL